MYDECMTEAGSKSAAHASFGGLGNWHCDEGEGWKVCHARARHKITDLELVREMLPLPPHSGNNDSVNTY